MGGKDRRWNSRLIGGKRERERGKKNERKYRGGGWGLAPGSQRWFAFGHCRRVWALSAVGPSRIEMANGNSISGPACTRIANYFSMVVGAAHFAAKQSWSIHANSNNRPFLPLSPLSRPASGHCPFRRFNRVSRSHPSIVPAPNFARHRRPSPCANSANQNLLSLKAKWVYTFHF